MNLLESTRGRKFLFFCLYLSEGAPIGFIWWMLPTKMKLAGVSTENISDLLAILAIPWAFKFIWAPLVDIVRSRRFGQRTWIISAQLGMASTLIPLVWLDLREDYLSVCYLLLLHAFAAATQDVAIDSLAISSTSHDERGQINGAMQAGMLLGRSLFGALALRGSSWLGLPIIFGLLIVTVLSSVLLIIFVTKNQLTDSTKNITLQSHFREFCDAVRVIAGRRQTWLGLALALLGGASFEAVGGLAGPFLVMHMSSSLAPAEMEVAIGNFYLWAVALMLVGALCAGPMSDRWGHRVTTAYSLLILNTLIVTLAIGDMYSMLSANQYMWLMLGIYFVLGTFVTCSYALLMDLVDLRLGATQFSAFMGITNMCEAWSVKLAGSLQSTLGYGFAFLALSLISLAAVPAILSIHNPKLSNLP